MNNMKTVNFLLNTYRAHHKEKGNKGFLCMNPTFINDFFKTLAMCVILSTFEFLKDEFHVFPYKKNSLFLI